MADKALMSAYINIIPSMKGFNTTLSKELGGLEGEGVKAGNSIGKGLTSGLSSPLKAVSGMVAGAFAVGIGVDLFKDAISSASQLQDVVAATSTVFGETALAGLEKWATGADKAFGATKQQALDAALTFGTFGKAAGLSGSDLTGFSTELAQLAGDMASFRGTSTEQAIQAVGAALRGEAEPIRAYGVLLDDATLKAQAMEMGIYSGSGTLTQQQKVLAAHQAILKQTSDAQGDFARTGDSAANTQKTFQASMENFKAEIGTAFLPVFSQLLGEFSKMLPELKEWLIPAIKDFGSVLLNDVLPAVKNVFSFIKDNASWLKVLAGVILGVVAVLGVLNAIISVATTIQWLFNAAWLANPITWIVLAIIVAIGLVIAAIWFFATNWDQVCAFFTDVWNNIVSFFSTTFAAIGQWFSDMWNGMLTGFQQFANWIGGILNTIGGFFASVWDGMVNGFKGAVNWIIGLFEGMINFIIDGINKFLGLLNGGLGAIKNLTGIDLQIGTLGKVSLPRLATGGIVMPTPGGTPLIAGEAGQAEAIIPLDKLSTMLNADGGKKQQTVVYNNYANPGLTSEQELLQAMKRGRIQGVV